MTISLPQRDTICANILAGGRASRMAGKDKGLLQLEGVPLVQHVIARLEPQVEHIVISANRHLDAYRRFGWPVLSDSLSGYPGPLAGILTALQHCRQDWVITVPCDGPFLPPDLVDRMIQAIKAGPRRACVVQTARGFQPTYCLVHRSLQDDLLEYMQKGGRKTGQWLKNQHPALADFSDVSDAFININTPDELDDARQRLSNPA